MRVRRSARPIGAATRALWPVTAQFVAEVGTTAAIGRQIFRSFFTVAILTAGAAEAGSSTTVSARAATRSAGPSFACVEIVIFATFSYKNSLALAKLCKGGYPWPVHMSEPS